MQGCLPIYHLRTSITNQSQTLPEKKTPGAKEATHLVLRLSGSVGQKGWLTHEHLIEDDTYAPPVAKLSVAAPLEHFRGDVIWRTD